MSSLRGENLPQAYAPPLAFSIREFCKAHRISTAFYYELKRDGLGPREMELGRRRLITVEAAAAWRKEREAVAT